MRIQLLDLAQEDLIEGYRFYESKEPGLGASFLTNLYADIESLQIYGGMHHKPYLHFHRALAKRFPFAIYYSVEGDVIRIRSSIDCRRRPSWIRRHLGDA